MRVTRRRRRRRFTLTRRGETRVARFQRTPSARRYEVERSAAPAAGAGHVRRRDRRGTLQCLHHARPPVPSAARPSVAREAQALREALALRQALAAGQTLTPAQAAALRTATAAAARTAPAGSRTAARRHRQPARRKPAARPRSAPAPASPPRRDEGRRAARRRPRTGARAGRPGCGVVAMSTLLLPAVAVLVLPGADDAGSAGGPLDATALALTAQTSLLEQAGRYRQLEQEVAAAADRAASRRATPSRPRARQVDAEQAGRRRDRRRPLPRGPGRALPAARAQRARRRRDLRRPLPPGPGRARRPRPRGRGGPRRARPAPPWRPPPTAWPRPRPPSPRPRDRAADVLATVRDEVEDLSPAVTAQLAALGAIPAAGAQQDRNAAGAWRAGRTTSASSPPPASSRRRPPTSPTPPTCPPGSPPPWTRPAGRCPASPGPSSATARSPCCPPRPSRPSARRCPSSASRSSPAPSGPDTYDCGGFTSAAWLLAGLRRPVDAAGPVGRPARRSPLTDLQIGDLVFSPGGQDVGIYLGDGDVVGASAGTLPGRRRARWRPAPRPPGSPCPPRRTPNAGAARRRRHRARAAPPCPSPGAVSPAWGGWANGQIPAEALCALGVAPPRAALRRRGVLRRR